MLSAAFIRSGVSLPSFGVVLRSLRGQTFEQLGEIDFGALGRFAQFNLQIFRGSVGILHRLAKMREQANGLDDFLFL